MLRYMIVSIFSFESFSNSSSLLSNVIYVIVQLCSHLFRSCFKQIWLNHEWKINKGSVGSKNTVGFLFQKTKLHHTCFRLFTVQNIAISKNLIFFNRQKKLFMKLLFSFCITWWKLMINVALQSCFIRLLM